MAQSMESLPTLVLMYEREIIYARDACDVICNLVTAILKIVKVMFSRKGKV
jgi:hypothetical protein